MNPAKGIGAKPHVIAGRPIPGGEKALTRSCSEIVRIPTMAEARRG